MFSLIIGRAVMGAVRGLEHPLARLESALAIWAGEKKGEHRQAVRVDVYVTQAEFVDIAKNKDLREAMGRAEVAKDMGAVPTCECCGAVA